jgi:hypothetical protein
MTKPKQAKDVPGEGNYTAARNFRKSEEKFVADNKNKIPDLARDAEKALDGPEGDDLKAAEERAKSHSHEKGR